MYLLIQFLLPGTFYLIAVFLGNLIGSEGIAIMTTTKNIVLFSIFMIGLIFLFRLLCFRKSKGFILKLLYISLLFFISVFCYFLRIYLLSRLGLNLSDLFSFFILSVGGLPLPAPSSPSSSSSWKEDSFEMKVLLEPFSETEMEGTGTSARSSIPRGAGDEAGPSHQKDFAPNGSFESSIRNRVLRLENDNSLFLCEKERGEYWTEKNKELDQTSSQQEYNQLLEFENRDLQIRERKHECFSLFKKNLSQHPALAEKLYYKPQEAFTDFFDEKQNELGTHQEWGIEERYKR